jgi:hypothetical protein
VYSLEIFNGTYRYENEDHFLINVVIYEMSLQSTQSCRAGDTSCHCMHLRRGSSLSIAFNMKEGERGGGGGGLLYKLVKM